MKLHKLQFEMDKAEHRLSEKETETAIGKATAEASMRDISALKGELKAHVEAAVKVLLWRSCGCMLKEWVEATKKCQHCDDVQQPCSLLSGKQCTVVFSARRQVVCCHRHTQLDTSGKTAMFKAYLPSVVLFICCQSCNTRRHVFQTHVSKEQSP